MNIHQTPRVWWQKLVSGLLRTPQDLIAATRGEIPDQAQAWMRFLVEWEDTKHWDIPKRLSAPLWLAPSQGLLDLWNRADWQYADERLMVWAAVFQELARKRGIPIYVHCCFRPEAEQARLLRDGFTKVGYPNSAHNIAEAIDIVHAVFHWNLTPQEWAYLGRLGREAERLVNAKLPKKRQIALNWGGKDGPNDKFAWDPAHWELSDYRQRTRRLPVGEPVRYTPRGILARRWL